MSDSAPLILRKLVVPLLVATTTGFVFFFAGEAYQTFGLAALDSSRQIISHILGMTLFLSVGVLLDRFVRHIIFDGFIASTLGSPMPGLLKQFSSMVIYLVTGGAILAVVFKQDLTVLWAASGVAGIVLGLALQALLQDIFSGLALNIDRPIKIGDSILLDGGSTPIEGEVLEISWRTTHILDTFHNVIVLPNNKLASVTITNYSKQKSYVNDFQAVTIDASIPHERVMRILLAAGIEACSTFSSESCPPPYVLVWTITPHGIEYRIHYFCDLWQKELGHTLTLQCVLKHLRQTGIRPAMNKLEHTPLDGYTWRSAFPSAPEVIHVLAACPMFDGLDSEYLTLLASKSNIQTIQADQEIVHAGEMGLSAFVLIEGLLTAIRKRGRIAQPMDMLSPGDCFGCEVALLGDAHTATIRSRTSAIVCEIDTLVFQALFSACPKAVTVLSHNLAKTMSATAEAAGGAVCSDVECIVSDFERTISRNFASNIRK
ncbi:MAG: mechanosensitive ion channel family protein [Deltaproteobacteria bacterium]